MTVVVIAAPLPVVSLDEAKAHIPVDFGDDDALIGSLIAACQQAIDGPPGSLGRSIGVQTLELRLSSLCGLDGSSCIPLSYGPIVEIASVKYVDAAGVEQTVDPSNYRLIDGRYLVPAFDGTWPSPRFDHEAVKIRYIAGYPDIPPVAPATVPTVTVPMPIKIAILMHVAHLYANREAVNFAANVNVLPLGAELLLSTYRLWL